MDSLPALPKSDDVEVHVFKPQEGLSTALVFKAMNLGACSTVIPESLLDCFQSDGFEVLTTIAIHTTHQFIHKSKPFIFLLFRNLSYPLSCADS